MKWFFRAVRVTDKLVRSCAHSETHTRAHQLCIYANAHTGLDRFKHKHAEQTSIHTKANTLWLLGVEGWTCVRTGMGSGIKLLRNMSDKTSTIIILCYSFSLPLTSPSPHQLISCVLLVVFFLLFFFPQGDSIFAPSFPSAALADYSADSTLQANVTKYYTALFQRRDLLCHSVFPSRSFFWKVLGRIWQRHYG